MKRSGLCGLICLLHITCFAQLSLPTTQRFIINRLHLEYGIYRSLEMSGVRPFTVQRSKRLGFAVSNFEIRKNAFTTRSLCSLDSIDMCNRALADARFHGKDRQHFLLGLYLSFPGLVAVLCTNYKPEKAVPKALYDLELNSARIDNEQYRDCYNKSVKKRMLGKTALGATCSFTIFLLFDYLLLEAYAL